MRSGIIIAFLTVALAAMLIPLSQTGMVALSDLYRTSAYASVAILDRLDGREPCLSIDDHLLSRYSELRDSIRLLNEYADSMGSYNEYHAFYLSGLDAYELAVMMVGGSTTPALKPHIDTLYSMREREGADGHISCVLEYGGRYYDLMLDPFGGVYTSTHEVYSNIPEDQGYVISRLTHVDLGSFRIIGLDEREHEVFPPFNNILILVNELESKVRVSMHAEGEGVDGPDHVVVIPPKESGMFILTGLFAASRYSYTVEPYSMEGRVILRPYSPCMGEDEVRHGYALAHFNVKMPSYIPDGYGYRCGIHVMNNYVKIYYSRDAADHAMHEEQAITDGVLVMHAYRLLSSEMKEWNWDSFVRSIEDESARYGLKSDVATIWIDGKRALTYRDTGVDYELHERYRYNVLTLYDDGALYTFKSRLLSIEDLADIAGSLR